jgi:hypothetical protein
MALKGNKNRQVHGGEAAISAIQRGEPFTGLALEAQLRVEEELAANGRKGMVNKNAIRLQACTDLFWDAIQKAAQDGDLERLDRYISRFGWLSGCSLRAWEQVRKEDPGGKRTNVIDMLKGGMNDGSD